MIQPNLHEVTMSGPGSDPVTPLPPPVQGVNPEPNASNDAGNTATPLGNPMPVNHPDVKPDGRPLGEQGPHSWQQSNPGEWMKADGTAGPWRETP
jgi:hypothetical protein